MYGSCKHDTTIPTSMKSRAHFASFAKIHSKRHQNTNSFLQLFFNQSLAHSLPIQSVSFLNSLPFHPFIIVCVHHYSNPRFCFFFLQHSSIVQVYPLQGSFFFVTQIGAKSPTCVQSTSNGLEKKVLVLVLETNQLQTTHASLRLVSPRVLSAKKSVLK